MRNAVGHHGRGVKAPVSTSRLRRRGPRASAHAAALPRRPPHPRPAQRWPQAPSTAARAAHRPQTDHTLQKRGPWPPRATVQTGFAQLLARGAQSGSESSTRARGVRSPREPEPRGGPARHPNAPLSSSSLQGKSERDLLSLFRGKARRPGPPRVPDSPFSGSTPPEPSRSGRAAGSGRGASAPPGSLTEGQQDAAEAQHPQGLHGARWVSLQFLLISGTTSASLPLSSAPHTSSREICILK